MYIIEDILEVNKEFHKYLLAYLSVITQLLLSGSVLDSGGFHCYIRQCPCSQRLVGAGGEGILTMRSRQIQKIIPVTNIGVFFKVYFLFFKIYFYLGGRGRQ